MKRKAPVKERTDPVRKLADDLRAKHGIDWQVAVMGGERVEFFRGKDFANFFRANPSRLHGLTTGGKKQEEQIKEYMENLLKRGMVSQAERMYKKPKPGHKRLMKWPKKLVEVHWAQQGWTEEAFYAWKYDRPTSPWLFIGSIALVIGTILACLFPLAPLKLKLVVVYLSLTFVGVLIGTIVLRTFVAAVTWCLLGRAFWIFPNMLSEELGLDQAFWPICQLEEVDEGWWWGAHLHYRLGLLALVASIIYLLLAKGPDKGSIGQGAKDAHDSLLEWLEGQKSGRQRLSGEAAAPPPTPVTPPDVEAQMGSPTADSAAAQPPVDFGADALTANATANALVNGTADATANVTTDATSGIGSADAGSSREDVNMGSKEEL